MGDIIDNKEAKEAGEQVVDGTKKSLSLLEKETWVNFFKKASDWIKNFFGIKGDDSKSTGVLANSSAVEKTEQKAEEKTEEKTEQNNKKTDNRNSNKGVESPIKFDSKCYTPGDYPFKHITKAFKGIQQYRVDNIKLKPLLSFNQLALKGDEGELTTLKVKDEKERFSTKTAGYKKNNPCNVSPFKGDVGRTGSSKVADGQNHGKYDSMEDGLASFMRLMRQSRYHNKSIQGINCSGMQGIYRENESDSLKALRVTWITKACESLKVSPFSRLNMDDKETMMAWAQETAIRESGSHFSRDTLEKAYKKAFG